jgi:glycosyltransferase involved in cell wall biosynthesis
MRIVLDIRHRGTRSGAVSYIRNLVPGLLRAASGREFVLLRSAGQTIPFDHGCEELIVPPHSPIRQAVHDQTILPRLLGRAGAHIYHPLKYLGTMFPPRHQVTTAHSITEDYHGTFPISAAEAVYWRWMGRQMFRRSAAVIAVSEFIKRFLVDRIGVEPDRITVAHNGIDPRFRQLPKLGHRPKGHDPYLLTVGNIFPVKNFVMAVDVLAKLAPEYPRLRLRMAGGTGHAYFRSVRAAVERADLGHRVDFLGYVEPDDLVELMNEATLLLMPSLTEGCPVTLLEAMACGAPTIASARGGIPEVGGATVALMEDPSDLAAWVAATRELLEDPGRRQRLGEEARARSSRFTWDATIRQTLDVYDSLAAN